MQNILGFLPWRTLLCKCHSLWNSSTVLSSGGLPIFLLPVWARLRVCFALLRMHRRVQVGGRCLPPMLLPGHQVRAEPGATHLCFTFVFFNPTSLFFLCIQFSSLMTGPLATSQSYNQPKAQDLWPGFRVNDGWTFFVVLWPNFRHLATQLHLWQLAASYSQFNNNFTKNYLQLLTKLYP